MALSPDSPGSIAAGTVLHRGESLLRLGLGLGLGLTLGVAWLAPEAVVLVPLVLLALIVGWGLFQHPTINLVVLLASFVVTLNYDQGIQTPELLYGLYYVAFMLHWYGDRLLRGEAFVRTRTDLAVAVLGFGGLLGGIVLGFLLGAPMDLIRGEATGFMMLSTYFPVKELCRQERYGPEVLLAIIFGIGFFVVTRYFLNFQEIILAATEMWQIADARPGINDIQLLVAGLTALVLLIHTPTWGRRLVLLVVLSLFVGGLIITKSRGYWIDFALGIFVLTLLLRGRTRWRLVVLVVGGTAVTVGLAFFFFGSIANLIISGTIERFSTLATAFSQDRSLINRFIENASIWEGIRRSPFLGYGFGTRITFFDINQMGTLNVSFMHNGYLALWFKLGLGGLVLMLFAWGSITWQGLQTFWSRRLPALHRLCALSASLTLIALIPSVSTSNPFWLMDQMFTFTLQLSIAAGIYQRYLLPGQSRTLAHNQPEGGEEIDWEHA